jgi:hypothetical protein
LQAVLVLLLAVVPVLAQAQNPTKADQTTTVRVAARAAIAALNFRQGDGAGLTRARADFTREGWKDFMKHMEGFLDRDGAPTFTSTFAASKAPRVLGEDHGIVHFRVPGKLTQSSPLGRTTYDRAAVEVYAVRDLTSHGERGIKIQRLEQITCLDASTACE